MDIFFYHSLSHWTLSAKWMYKKSLHIITYCIWLWRLGKILKSAPQKWKKLPISRAKNDRENSIFFRSRSQKKRLKIRSKSDLVSRVKRDWKSDRKRIVRSHFDLFLSSSSLLRNSTMLASFIIHVLVVCHSKIEGWWSHHECVFEKDDPY